jgi:hypothetical protein
VLEGERGAQSIELDRPSGGSLARAMLGRFGFAIRNYQFDVLEYLINL